MPVPGSRRFVIWTAAGVFIATGILPLGHMIASVSSELPAQALLLDARQRVLLANTVQLATMTAVLATLVGAPLGFGLARVLTRRTVLYRIALAAPVLLPPYTVALAWVYVGGSAGFGATMVGRDWLAGWTYSLPAAAVVLSLVYYPIVMLATEAALRQMDPHLEEAALIAAHPSRALRRITIPLVTPAVGSAALVVFVLATSEFGVPALLRVRVYTTEVFTAFAALFDFARAAALTIPLLVLATAASAVAAAPLSSRIIAAPRRSSAGTFISLVAWHRPIRLLAVVAFVLALLLPAVILVGESENIIRTARGSWPSIRTSLMLSALGATLVLLVGGTLGYGRARASAPIGRIADVLWIVLFAVPSTIVGVALIGLWNRSGPLGLVYGTTAMLVLVYLARFVPVAALIVAASVRQVPVSHEEAASVAGSGWLRTMGTIVVPQVGRGLGAAWVVVFVFAFGELGASILVAPPGESTLPIRIYTIIANTPSSVVAALALLQVIVIALPLAGAALYASRRRA